MKVAVCGSMAFAEQMKALARDLSQIGHTVLLPDAAGGFEPPEGPKQAAERKLRFDLIRRHWDKICTADAILVVNWDKDGMASYIGGNTFLEMGFAHVLHKPIFVLKSLPDVSYSAEITAMSPVVIHDELERIQ